MWSQLIWCGTKSICKTKFVNLTMLTITSLMTDPSDKIDRLFNFFLLKKCWEVETLEYSNSCCCLNGNRVIIWCDRRNRHKNMWRQLKISVNHWLLNWKKENTDEVQLFERMLTEEENRFFIWWINSFAQ